jgi:hypothetical protein
LWVRRGKTFIQIEKKWKASLEASPGRRKYIICEGFEFAAIYVNMIEQMLMTQV